MKFRQFRDRILFGTDDIAILPLLQSMLETENMRSLTATSGCFGMLMLFMICMALLSPALHHNLRLYSCSCILCFAIFIVSKAAIRKGHRFLLPVFYLQLSAALVFGILLGNFSQKVSSAVTFNVMLVAFPFLIFDVPWRINLLLVITETVFLVTAHYRKPADIFALDMTNSLSFLCVAVFINTTQQIRHMENFYNTLIVKRQRDTDGLTGLLNKAALESRIRGILQYGNHKAAMMIVDIDNFKRINDMYGHSVGDYFIADTAHCLSSVCRSTDIIGRFGGDEFVLCFPDMSKPEQAGMKADEIIKRMHTSFSKNETGETITVSVGCTFFPDCGRTYEALFDQMDAALYQAKNSGKDTFCIYESPSQR